MSKLDWDEVKQLAADFQRAQLNTSLQKLSERNVIEIVCKLIEKKLISLYFTNNGKEYITPAQLRQEIIDETYLAKGRLDITDMANILNVSFSIVQAQCNELVKVDRAYQIILGQLIHEDYLKHVAVEINELLNKNGNVTIGELTKTFALPGDVLQSIIERNLNTIIQNVLQDKSDMKLFYTEGFVNRNRRLIRGALLAINKPTQLVHIIKLVNIDTNVFNIIIDQLINSKQIGGQLTNRNSLNNCMYIPHHYIKEQNEYIENFYKINNYLEYDNLKRYNINEPVSFIRKHFAKELDKMLFLNSCCVNEQVIDQIVSNIEEAIDTDSLIDVSNIAPTLCNDKDVDEIIKHLFTKRNLNANNNVTIFSNVILVSNNFVNKINKHFKDEVIKLKCETIVKSGEYMKFMLKHSSRQTKDDVEEKVDKASNKRDERRKKAAGGKLGGGAQGRETKTKSVKKKMGGTSKAIANEMSDEDEEKDELNVLSKDDVKDYVENANLLNDIDLVDPDEFVNELAESILPELNKIGLAMCREIYESTLQNNSDKRKVFGQFESKALSMYYDIILYNKSVRLFDAELKGQLSKHLIKTICNDLINLIVVYLAKNEFSESNDLNVDQRAKLIAQIPNQDLVKKVVGLTKIGNVDEFLTSLEVVFQNIDIYIKKLDKKKEKQIVLNHKYILIEELKQVNDNDAALVLHLVVLILFTIVHEQMLHASGKFVYNVLLHLRTCLSADVMSVLMEFHDKVVKMFTVDDESAEGEEEKEVVREYLKQHVDRVKQIAIQYKHTSKEKEK